MNCRNNNKIDNKLFVKAIEKNDIEFVKELLDKDFDINCEIKPLFSALTYSIIMNANDITKLLIENNADLNKQNNKYNYTPLMLLLSLDTLVMRTLTIIYTQRKNNYMEIFKLLLKYGADINLKNNNGNTALQLCIERTNYVERKNNNYICKLLIENGANINISNNNGNTPLMHSLLIENMEMVLLLLNNGADYNITNINEPIYSALDNCIIISIFVKIKKINYDMGILILETLIDKKYIEIVKILLNKKLLVRCSKN